MEEVVGTVAELCSSNVCEYRDFLTLLSPHVTERYIR